MLDIWMIFCIMYPFFIVVLHTLSKFLTEAKSKIKSLAEETNFLNIAESVIPVILEFVLPILSCIFISVFWIFGIKNYFWSDIKTSCEV